jgi:hypothetical protein
MTFNLKQKISKVFVHLQCSLLLLRNLVFAKKFSLKQFSYVNNLVVPGNKSELLWIVSGCHKIFIKGFGVIPGNTSGINFIYQSQQNTLEITFFGIGHKETKEVRLEATSIKLTDKFIPKTITPQLTSIPLAHQKLRCVLTESANIIIDIQTSRITPLNLNIQHEPFIKSNYLTKTL